MEILFVDCFGTMLLSKRPAGEGKFRACVSAAEKYGIDPNVMYRAVMSAQRTCDEGETLTGAAREAVTRLKRMGEARADTDAAAFAEDVYSMLLEDEKKHQRANTELEKLLREKKQAGARIYIVSDYFCGREYIGALLEANGIADIFDDIFVSCDMHATKRSGRLFSMLLEKLGVGAKDVTMFGNSASSDIAPAYRLGIKPVRAGKEEKIFDDGAALGRGRCPLPKGIKKISSSGSTAWSDYAFPLYAFTSKLYEELREKGAEDVFFLSREGQMLKRLFDLYAQGKAYAPRTHYFMASRNSLYAATLTDFEHEDLARLFNAKNDIKARDLLAAVGIRGEECERILDACSVGGDTSYNSGTFPELKRALALNAEFIRRYDEIRKQRRSNVNKYISGFFPETPRRMYIVDVGWKGSMQDFLREITGMDMCGYYIGYNGKGVPCDEHNEKHGLLWSMSPLYPDYIQSVFRMHYLDWEEILRADHDQVMDYEERDGSVVPAVNTDTEEGKAYDRLAKKLQDETEEKFKRICALAPDERACARMYARMFARAGKNEHVWTAASVSAHWYTFGVTGRAVKQSFNMKKYIRYRLGAVKNYILICLGKGRF